MIKRQKHSVFCCESFFLALLTSVANERKSESEQFTVHICSFVCFSETLLQDQENFGVYHSEQRVCKWKGSSGSTRLKGPYPPLCRKKWGNRGPLNLLSILPNFFCVVRKRLMGKLYVNGRFHLWEHFSGTKNYNVKVFLLTETLTGGIFSIWVVTNNNRQWTASKDLYPPIIMSFNLFLPGRFISMFPLVLSITHCLYIYWRLQRSTTIV